MKVTIGERFSIGKLLPEEANFVTLKVIRDLQDDLSPSEEEIKKFNINSQQMSDGKVKTFWNAEGKTYEKTIKFGEKATDIVVEALKNLEKESKLTLEFLPLYEKFIENK